MEWVNVCLNSSLQQLRDANLKVAVTKFCHCFGDAQSSNKHCDNYRKKRNNEKDARHNPKNNNLTSR